MAENQGGFDKICPQNLSFLDKSKKLPETPNRELFISLPRFLKFVNKLTTQGAAGVTSPSQTRAYGQNLLTF